MENGRKKKTEGGRNAALWMQAFGFIEEEGKVQMVFNLTAGELRDGFCL